LRVEMKSGIRRISGKSALFDGTRLNGIRPDRDGLWTLVSLEGRAAASTPTGRRGVQCGYSIR
jgi:hypothetical protein